ncbi:hypothetical protein ACQR3P_29145 [Rhodococcus sp. IEGM1300]
MAQYMILLNVDDEKLKENNPGGKEEQNTQWVEGELGWLEQSGMSIQEITPLDRDEYVLSLPNQRVLGDEKLVVEVGGDVDYPRVSIMRELEHGNLEELVRLERNADEGVRTVTYMDQDGLEESETRTIEIYFTNPMEILFDHFRIEAHSLSAQRLSYDDGIADFSYDSPEVYGDTEFIYISDIKDGFELSIVKQEEADILPQVAAFFKEIDYDVDLFKAQAQEKFIQKEVAP